MHFHAWHQVPLLVARYAATGQLEAAVEAAARVQQDSDAAVAAALAFAAVLERMIVAGDSLQARPARGGPGHASTVTALRCTVPKEQPFGHAEHLWVPAGTVLSQDALRR